MVNIFKILLVIFFFNAVIFAKTETDYNVKNYGAVGNGITLDTESIQKAIDSAYNNGGGVVVIPGGTYKVGTLIIKDNVNLHLESGAVIIGSENIADYAEIHQKLESRTNKLYAKYFIIFAEGAKNISITGSGVINGNGLKNYQVTRPQNMRPFLMRLVNCSNVTIKDVQLLESANWTLHLLGCNDVTVDGVKIANTTKANRDGLDIDACKNVTVSNCKIYSQDDAIVLKATNNTVCENIAITNCILTSYASAIKTGTESNGGFKNISVSNCIIKNIPIYTGIELMIVDGGNMENISVSNIVMDSVATPIYIYLGNRARPYKIGQYVNKVAKVEGINISNINVTNAKFPCGVVGINNRKVKNISFNNISIKYSESLKEKPLAVNKVPYKDLSYPSARMHGTNLPSFAFYCRNVKELSLNNIKVYAAEGERRPAFVFDKAENLELKSVGLFSNTNTSTLFYLRNTDNVISTLCGTKSNNNSLFKIEKQTCNNIKSINNILQEGQREIEKINALADIELFANIETTQKYSVKNGDKIDKLIAQKIADEPISFEFEITGKTTPQICILIKNNSDYPEEVILHYKNIEQTFIVDWNNWGWAPIALLTQFDKKEKIKFTVKTKNKNSELWVSKIYLKDLKLGYTD